MVQFFFKIQKNTKTQKNTQKCKKKPQKHKNTKKVGKHEKNDEHVCINMIRCDAHDDVNIKNSVKI